MVKTLVLSLLRVRVQSLVRELRYHKPHGAAKKKKKKAEQITVHNSPKVGTTQMPSTHE